MITWINLILGKEKIFTIIKPATLIVFGSSITLKKESSKPYSDLDLLIVSDRFHNQTYYARNFLMKGILEKEIGMPVDLICFTKNEFNNLKKDSELMRILRNGCLIINKEGIELWT